MYDVDLQAAWRTYLEILFRDHGQNDFVGQPHLAFDRGQQLAHQLRPPVTGDNQTDLHAPKTLLTSKTASERNTLCSQRARRLCGPVATILPATPRSCLQRDWLCLITQSVHHPS